MKIYVGPRQINENNIKSIQSLDIIEHVCEDSQCEIIILDMCLNKYPISKLDNMLKLALRKLRINGEIIISDIDFDLLSYLYSYNKEGVVGVNNLLQSIGPASCFLTIDLVESLLKNSGYNLLPVTKSVDNLEFRVSYRRQQ